VPRAVGGDTLVGQPDLGRRCSSLPEHIDWNSATRTPVGADPQINGLKASRDTFANADGDRDLFVKAALVAKGREIELY
jgi:hypothetical protein